MGSEYALIPSLYKAAWQIPKLILKASFVNESINRLYLEVI